MDDRPVIQNFLGKPVRFFKDSFQVELPLREGNLSVRVFALKTYATPLPDFCSAIGCKESRVISLIESSREVFQGLYRTERLPDIHGRIQPCILMAQELVEILISKILAAAGKDPLTRARMFKFQRWFMLTVGLIRNGKFQFIRNSFNQFKEATQEYRDILFLRSGHEIALRVKAIAEKEGVYPSTVYARLRQMRGGNVINGKGVPRKTRGGR